MSTLYEAWRGPFVRHEDACNVVGLRRGVHLPSLVHEYMREGDDGVDARQHEALAQQASRPAGDHNRLLCQNLLG